MTASSESTRAALIEAAGELFAEKGFEGTSIRAIAARANANIAAVNYHFGSKENLHLQVLRHVVNEDRCTFAASFLADESRLSTPQGISDVLYEIIQARFRDHLLSGTPSWHWKVILRSFLEPSEALQEVVRDFWEPDHVALKGVFARLPSCKSDLEAELAAVVFHAPVIIFTLARTPLLMVRREEEYSPEYILAATDQVARIITSGFGLPLPAALDSSRSAQLAKQGKQ